MDSPFWRWKVSFHSFLSALFFVLLVSEFNWNSITWPESNIPDSNVSVFPSFLQHQKQSCSVSRAIHLEQPAEKSFFTDTCNFSCFALCWGRTPSTSQLSAYSLVSLSLRGSELILKLDSLYFLFCGAIWTRNLPITNPVFTKDKLTHKRKRIHIYSSSWIRTRSPNVRLAEGSDLVFQLQRIFG